MVSIIKQTTIPRNNFNDTISWSQFNQGPSRPAGEIEDAHIKTRMKLNYDMGGKGKATIISSANLALPVLWLQQYLNKTGSNKMNRIVS